MVFFMQRLRSFKVNNSLIIAIISWLLSLAFKQLIHSGSSQSNLHHQNRSFRGRRRCFRCRRHRRDRRRHHHHHHHHNHQNHHHHHHHHHLPSLSSSPFIIIISLHYHHYHTVTKTF